MASQQQRDRSDYSRFRITFATKIVPENVLKQNGQSATT